MQTDAVSYFIPSSQIFLICSQVAVWPSNVWSHLDKIFFTSNIDFLHLKNFLFIIHLFSRSVKGKNIFSSFFRHFTFSRTAAIQNFDCSTISSSILSTKKLYFFYFSAIIHLLFVENCAMLVVYVVRIAHIAHTHYGSFYGCFTSKS